MENNNNNDWFGVKGVVSKSQVAEAYGITTQTLRNWLIKFKFYEKHPENFNSNVFTPKQLKDIVDHLGEP